MEIAVFSGFFGSGSRRGMNISNGKEIPTAGQIAGCGFEPAQKKKGFCFPRC
jgi:hypothetical protein